MRRSDRSQWLLKYSPLGAVWVRCGCSNTAPRTCSATPASVTRRHCGPWKKIRQWERYRASHSFVHQDSHWLIDELAADSPGGTPVSGPPLPPAATPSASHEITIVMADFVFRPATVAIPANTPVTITLVNQGKLPHSFVTDALHVRVELRPGQRGQVVLDIPPGTYEFSCDIPGHKAVGMIGHLMVTAGGMPVPTS